MTGHIQSAFERELFGVRCDQCRRVPGVRLFDGAWVCGDCAVVLSDRLTAEQLGISKLKGRRSNGSNHPK
jgi:ribosomal protein L37AE/L43A